MALALERIARKTHPPTAGLGECRPIDGDPAGPQPSETGKQDRLVRHSAARRWERGQTCHIRSATTRRLGQGLPGANLQQYCVGMVTQESAQSIGEPDWLAQMTDVIGR